MAADSVASQACLSEFLPESDPAPANTPAKILRQKKPLHLSAPLHLFLQTASPQKPKNSSPRTSPRFSARRIVAILFSFLIILVAFPSGVHSGTQNQPVQTGSPQTDNNKSPIKKVARAQKINPHAPAIDGRLDDSAWEHGEWYTDFIQFHPYEGQVPTEQTAFKILYDNSHLYVAIRCYDSQP